MDINDRDISLIIREDPRALLKLYRQVVPELKRFFLLKVADENDREELVQDTILSIVDSLPQFKRQSQFSTWCLSIAKHELVDYYRRKKIKAILFSRLPFLQEIVDKALGPQLALEEKEAKGKIFKTLHNLTEGYSEILRLRYIEGLSVSAIAKELNLTYKAAESKLSRARLAFQAEFVCQSTALPTPG